MSRSPRLVEPNVAFHVTARGNYQQDIFLTPQDRADYLKILASRAAIEGLKLLGWCLMSNHVHLLVVPQRRDSLARTMQRTQGEFALLMNQRLGQRLGHLWQGRFFSCPMDGDSAWTALRYIELNPVRAGIVESAETSSWSSAAAHCGLVTSPQFLDLEWWRRVWTPERWRSVLAYGRDERIEEALREATRRGFPFGSEAFLEQQRRQTGHDFLIRPPGRPCSGVRPAGGLKVRSARGGTA